MQPTVQMREVWTFADVQTLDVDDWWRYEIVDGALVVSPSTGGDHELASAEVRAAIWAASPSGVKVVGPMGVNLGRSYLIPDLVVAPLSALRGALLLEPVDTVLVVEVVSPSSEAMDRLLKPAKYAAAGIGAYWRVETDPVSLTAYVLREGTYTEIGTWAAGETAEITEPFSVRVDLAELAAN